jgi:L-ribulose-5-phosphate 3-epimerase
MSDHLSRRAFVKTAGAALIGSALLNSARPARAGELTGRIKKAVKYNMIKEDLSVMDKFKLLKDLGFDGVEPRVQDKVGHDEMLKASEATGIPIHGVVNGSVENINAAVDLAKFYGSTSVLVCAGRVSADVPYAQNWDASQAKIRAALPYAEQAGIRLLVENVWNNFLLTPLELARYIDELESEWVGVYFDVGNVARYGWPQHWIPVLDKRIHKLDIKPYSQKKQMAEGPWKGFQVELGDGDIDWAAVRAELTKIDYNGWATAEVGAADRKRLADIAARMDRVLSL